MIVFLILSIFFLDRLTKYCAITYLTLHQSIPVITNVFHITLVHNRGAAFGLGKNQIALFIITSLVAIVFIAYSLRQSRVTVQSYALALICAGALGNLIDRVFFGYVIDFLDFRIWPVFNVADSSITIGACLLGWSLVSRKSKVKSEKCK